MIYHLKTLRKLPSIGPKSNLYPAQEGIDGIKGAESVDGLDACVREVRKQIGAGADWIKVGSIHSLYIIRLKSTFFI
jgi:hypothetical protein